MQIGASIMMQSARFGGMEQARGLILAGSAAGIAAAFNTPLAGVVFAIEEMGRAYAARTNGLVLSAVILAGLASLGLVGNYNYFGLTTVTASTGKDWVLVIACGVIGGAFGAAFSALALELGRRVRRRVQKLHFAMPCFSQEFAASSSQSLALHPADRPSVQATIRHGALSKGWLFRLSTLSRSFLPDSSP